MKRVLLMGLIFALVLGAAPATRADEEESSFSWNPFKSKKKKAEPRVTALADDEERGLSFPKLSLPSLKPKPKPRRPRNQPSTLQKLGRGTKNFFGKTKDLLTPWDDSTDEEADYRMADRDTDKSRFSWFRKEPEDERPISANEFLKQSRVPIR